MGLLDWLFHRRSAFQPEPDRVFITAAPKWNALARLVEQRLDAGDRVLIIAYFPATLRELQERLASQGILIQTLDRPISGDELPSLLPDVHSRTVLVAPLPTLLTAPESGLDQQAAPPSPDPLTIIVPEAHPLLDAERRLLAFAAAIPLRVRVQPFASLDEPLMNIFAGARVQQLLRQLGMKEDDPIESPLVSRQIRRAQERLSQRVQSFEPADSAAEWIQRNVPAE
jgi:hypothetical protein